MTYYRTLGPIAFLNDGHVVQIPQTGILIDLTSDQAAALEGLVVLATPPTQSAVYDLGIPSRGDLANCTGYKVSNLDGDLDISQLSESEMTIAGNATPLGGTLTQDQITGLSANGLVKRTGANTLAPAVAGTDFQAPLQSPTLNTTAVKTTTYTAAVSDLVLCDASGGTFTVTLPSAPPNGSRVSVKKVKANDTNTVTIAAGGSDVFNAVGGGTTLTLVLPYQAAAFQYTSGIWVLTSTDVPLGQLDTRYTGRAIAFSIALGG